MITFPNTGQLAVMGCEAQVDALVTELFEGKHVGVTVYVRGRRDGVVGIARTDGPYAAYAVEPSGEAFWLTPEETEPMFHGCLAITL